MAGPDGRIKPPDFDALPKINGLPDPLQFPYRWQNRCCNAGDWKGRRAEIKQLFENYELGSLPPKPKN